ncbi:MAG TPA: efflux RND transporter periplasmic adaptor subunit [Bryobacteraceae bacterium]|nr:efflux RND transporter periplasmic adaptor subunit [Bryobacteraceae bacterium]HPU71678.1 efflux RND transporter periplasmic adaptor subunit [Bryobacteraceae bacterium]
MSRARVALIVIAVPIVALAWWIHRRNTSPREVPFTKVKRESLVSMLSTNGKVEPAEWVFVKAERPGVVLRVLVEKGQRVEKGALLVELDPRDARAEVASAEAAVAGARAQLQVMMEGGRSAEKVEIENALERNRRELRIAERDYESLKRLLEKHAATKMEVAEALQKVQQLQADIEALERKRAALVESADRASAEAKLREAEAALEQARTRLARSRIVAPISGTVYELSARRGSYVNTGDTVAEIGELGTLRVRVYVDEPELGRVAEGMPAVITWDAMPERQWKGTVEKMPTQIVALGTRQVGEVIVTIENADQSLLPGTNINAEIISQVVDNGLTIPKEAIRRENDKMGVYVLRGDHVEWQDVELGASSVTRAVVTQGLSEGDLVALTTDQPLSRGERVKPVMR